MAAPIDMMLDGVTWVAHELPEGDWAADGAPYATHSGVLEIMGLRFRCYRLSTGQAVFAAEDVEKFLNCTFTTSGESQATSPTGGKE